MGYRILRALSWRPEAGNENAPERTGDTSHQALPGVRSLATGAALAVAVDASPAVLVTLHDYAQTFRGRGRRTA
jgi:hypothetical protein